VSQFKTDEKLKKKKSAKILKTELTEKEQEKNEYEKAMINQIWELYDEDKNGTLDQEETKRFMIDYLEMVDGDVKNQFDDEVFN